MHFFKSMATIFALLIWVLPATASDIADVLLESMPVGLEEWSVQTGSKHKGASGVKAFGMYSIPAEDRLFVIEVDVGSKLVANIAATWNTQMSIAEVVEIGSVKYIVGSDGLTAMIDGKMLIRAYSPDADERVAIEMHLDGLDVDALHALTDELQ